MAGAAWIDDAVAAAGGDRARRILRLVLLGIVQAAESHVRA
jgi:hypothetical protein